MKTRFAKARVTRQYLVIEFTLVGQLVKHRHTVRVPWRALNTIYRPLVEALDDDAHKALAEREQPALLPLEVWE